MCGGAVSAFEKPIDPRELEQLTKIELQKEELARAKALFNDELKRITSLVRNGKSISLYKSFYISVNSEIEYGSGRRQINPYDDSRVKQAGLFGWQIIGLVPKTFGSALVNQEGFGKAWAGGIGGNVIGSYVLMEYKLTSENLEDSLEILKETIRGAYNIS